MLAVTDGKSERKTEKEMVKRKEKRCSESGQSVHPLSHLESSLESVMLIPEAFSTAQNTVCPA